MIADDFQQFTIFVGTVTFLFAYRTSMSYISDLQTGQ